ncbi:MAG: hypothetical protein MRY21_03295 [Simkaniaceae bacterium]|nr:hypothetical protein [Simkaniaceae bacterium]
MRYFLSIFLFSYLFSIELPCQFTHKALRIRCTEEDRARAEELVNSLDEFYSKQVACIGFEPAEISLRFYPDVSSLHERLGLVNYPKWAIASNAHHMIQIVVPWRAGPFHNVESTTRILKLNLISELIQQRYGALPYWVVYGVSSYLSDYHKYPPDRLPTIEEMENRENISFHEKGGNLAAFAFAKSLEGRLFEVLSDYETVRNEYIHWRLKCMQH